ncbi:iron-sulfur cluster assembly scaffold protein [Erythrobacter crassostreae]|uniref:Iron-sulfur cluster assembly scaffold protein n=1 Tax=Erythrobacter crassostreae TaxID=2828328 RepID=A0A9X1JN16_9SPHN|nr:iron-sulfur cluster assembly scaffold protein [Erythrobacter crassostrea]MBV7260004.1 iron-sulfur cluster assembly scaffold protein [Erythrobacter crassostrea]
MREGSTAKLYSPELLALSATLADFPLSDNFDVYAEAHSRTCGSKIKIGLSVTASQTFRVGMQVSACAVGQSSAAILAQGVGAASMDELAIAQQEIEAWLAGAGSLPDWPGFDALAPALPYPGRHEAILLPWRAVTEALSSPLATG